MSGLAQEHTVTYLYDGGRSPGEKSIDAIHLTDSLWINPYTETVNGVAEFLFVPMRNEIDTIRLNVMDMQINSVWINGAPSTYIVSGNLIKICTGIPPVKTKTYSLIIDYISHHPSYLYFSGWNDPQEIKRKQVWAHRPFSWIPYLDDRLTIDMIVTFDNKFKVFSNGERVDVVVNDDSTITWHYRMNKPHPFFSTALVIGSYDYLPMQTGKGLPLEMWYYPDQQDRVETTYKYMVEMIDFFEKDMGFPYPWELYRQAPVVDYLYGAMETTTSTIFGDYMFVDERAFSGRNYINVNAHELAHQWFGNYISHLAPKDVWLTESFATYYAKIFERSVLGEDYYQNVRKDEWLETMEAEKKDQFGTGHSSGGRARWYPKGSLILDMLRDVMGDDNFRTAIRYYLEHFPYQDAETADFLRAIYYSTGLDMEWFFEEWIYRGGEPWFEIREERGERREEKMFTRISVRQVQETGELVKYFRMPVVVEVHYTDGSSGQAMEWVDGPATIIDIPNPENKDVAFVLFDPGRKILKNVTFQKSFDELSAQVMQAPQMIDRYDGLLALDGIPVDQKRELLTGCYNKETFQLTRSEIIRQLAGDRHPATDQLLQEAIRDQDVYVRRAVLQHVRQVPEPLKTSYEILLGDSSYINVELALENLVRSYPGETERYLALTADEEGWRGKNIRVKWLELAIGSGKDQYLEELTGYSSLSYEFETRQNALMALKRLNYLDGEVAVNLYDALLYWNFKLVNTAKEVFTYFMQQNAYNKLLTDYYHSKHWEPEDQKFLMGIICSWE
jgi:aminopeptidase N